MRWGPPLKRLTTGEREALYETARGDNEFPSCDICGQPVRPHQDWDQSHGDLPRALDGTVTGIAHRRCNHRDMDFAVTLVLLLLAMVAGFAAITAVLLAAHWLAVGLARGVERLMGEPDVPRL